MKNTKLHLRSYALAALLSVVLALQGILPSAAFAVQRAVHVDNHTVATDQTTALTNITIDGVDKPVVGAPLDREATVSAEGDVTWDVPVLWVRDDLNIGDDVAQSEHTYLPVLAFFVPQGYALAKDVYAVTLSDSLTELFGTNETISVYDASTGITYILPASLRDLFAHAGQTEATEASAPSDASFDAAPSNAVTANKSDEAPALGLGGGTTIVDVYCAKTARDVLTDEDLQWLIELIIDYLEPQAVTFLLNNFPSFREGAAKGEIGKEIGLYIYYKTGDKDGKPGHNIDFDALAFVSADAARFDGELKYCYLLGVNVSSLIQKDASGNPITDPTTHCYRLVRDGEAIDTFRNTMVHEIFHALMDDYNRTGMAGAVALEDMEADENNKYIKPWAGERFGLLHFPMWFIEGTASAVENVYQLRYDTFQLLRRLPGADGTIGTGKLNPEFTSQLLIDNYVSGNTEDGKFAYLSIDFAEGGKDSNGQTIDTHASRYVTGYLATLYLAELTVRYAYSGQSTVKVVDGVTTIDSDMLRAGLDIFLKWNHEGSTMDALINSLSKPKEGEAPRYKDTEDFQRLFIKGPKEGDSYMGDGDAQAFVVTFLNYMLYLESKLPEGEHPNGSILFDFADRFTSPIGSPQKSISPYLQIVDKNVCVPSTVKSDTPNIGGGKSDLPTQEAAPANGVQATAEEASLPVAAKEGVAVAAEPSAEPTDKGGVGKEGADDVVAPLETSASNNTAGTADADAGQGVEQGVEAAQDVAGPVAEFVEPVEQAPAQPAEASVQVEPAPSASAESAPSPAEQPAA